ncbi:hypothetical protein [Glycomyces harbinensis]|uniref:hypothetical protein n=1 Tax=Glycomyces harbinensis TaxID=58114 RepID=UPI00115FB7F0|nr:hypothetical protein [Glycomyces harbinensis]
MADAFVPLLPAGARQSNPAPTPGRGVTTLLFTLLPAATPKGLWCAMGDVPYLCPSSAITAGVDLKRLALVETPMSSVGSQRLERSVKAFQSWPHRHPAPRIEA